MNLVLQFCLSLFYVDNSCYYWNVVILHKYVSSFIHPFMHACMHVFLPSFLPACLPACLPSLFPSRPITHSLVLIGPMRTLEAGRKITPSIKVWSRCSSKYANRACSFSSPRLVRPRLLLPSDAHVSAILEMLSGLFMKTYQVSPSSHLYEGWHRCTLCGFLQLFVAQMVGPRSPHDQLSLLRHVQWSTPSLLRSVAVTLHVSAPHDSTDWTFAQPGLLADFALPPDVLTSGECSSH